MVDYALSVCSGRCLRFTQTTLIMQLQKSIPVSICAWHLLHFTVDCIIISTIMSTNISHMILCANAAFQSGRRYSLQTKTQ